MNDQRRKFANTVKWKQHSKRDAEEDEATEMTDDGMLDLIGNR